MASQDHGEFLRIGLVLTRQYRPLSVGNFPLYRLAFGCLADEMISFLTGLAGLLQDPSQQI